MCLTTGDNVFSLCLHVFEYCSVYYVYATWWRYQMETFSALLALCAGNSPVTVNSPHKSQWRGALMNKQSRRCWKGRALGRGRVYDYNAWVCGVGIVKSLYCCIDVWPHELFVQWELCKIFNSCNYAGSNFGIELSTVFKQILGSKHVLTQL